MKWPFFAKREMQPDDADMDGNDRAHFTELIVAGMQATAEGSTASPADLAVVGTAFRAWSTALTVAAISPSASVAAQVLTPNVRAYIAGQLLLTGNAVLALESGMDGLTAVPVYAVADGGSHDPASWLYTVTFSGPSTSTSQRRRGSDLLHFRLETTPYAPWRGVSPLVRAGLDARFLAHITKALGEVANTPHGFFFSDGAFEDEATLASVIAAYRTARGRAIAMTRSVSGQQQQHQFTQFGGHAVKLDTGLNSRLDHATNQIAAAAGIHPSMLSAAATGTTIREAWRQLAVHLQGIGERLADEIAFKLDERVAFDFGRLAGNALRERAQSYRQLIAAGMDRDAAARVCGFGS